MWSCDCGEGEGRLSHVVRMPGCRLLKSLLFGWLSESCPRCGPRRRWRYMTCKDVKDVGVDKSEWNGESPGL